MSSKNSYLVLVLILSYVVLGVLSDDPTAVDDASTAAGDSIKASCGGEGANHEEYNLPLHIGALFIILATSSFGAFIPVISSKYPTMRIPKVTFFITKHFGTGVILATAFIHMLPTAMSSLTEECLPEIWNSTYPAFPGAFAMAAALFIFFIEYLAISLTEDHNANISAIVTESKSDPGNHIAIDLGSDVKASAGHGDYPAHGHLVILTSRAQTLGIVILEFGICLHSIIIGMALSVATGGEFVSLLCALVFHQMFEGLGLGSRIAELTFPDGSLKPWLMSLAYGTTTPIGIGIGLGVRYSYDPGSQTALLVQGILDSISAGILLYAALVELLAGDFIMTNKIRRESGRTQIAAFSLVLLGAGLMALIGVWA